MDNEDNKKMMKKSSTFSQNDISFDFGHNFCKDYGDRSNDRPPKSTSLSMFDMNNTGNNNDIDCAFKELYSDPMKTGNIFNKEFKDAQESTSSNFTYTGKQLVLQTKRNTLKQFKIKQTIQ